MGANLPLLIVNSYFTEITADQLTNSVASGVIFGGAYTIPGTGPFDYSGANSLTVAEGNVLDILFMVTGHHTNADRQGFFRLGVDGLPGLTGRSTHLHCRQVTSSSSASLKYRTAALAAGLHTVQIYWYMDGGAGSLRCYPASLVTSDSASLTIREMRL